MLLSYDMLYHAISYNIIRARTKVVLVKVVS